MEISSDFVGTPLKPYQAAVHWRDTMNYAAAIKDDNPHYFDDERREGIIGHPMFAVAATWPIIENLPEFIESDDFPQEILLTLCIIPNTSGFIDPSSRDRPSPSRAGLRRYCPIVPAPKS